MSAVFSQSRFFMETDVLAHLSSQYKESDAPLTMHISDFGIDLIDQPFFCAVDSEEDCIEIKLFVRSEIGSFLELPDLCVQFFAGEKSKVTASSGRLGSNEAVIAQHFFKAAAALLLHLADTELLDSFSRMDAENEGVIVSFDDDELSFVRVCGKKRPLMACTTLSGDVKMMRPYQNEIMDSWLGDMLSPEDKIALAEDGDEDMMEKLAHLYLNGDEETAPDPQKAVYWFKKLAALGHSDAQFNLGLHYAKGFGVERSFARAVEWMEKAEENGDADAPGILEKLRKAVAAEKIMHTGNAQAQADLAAAYMFLGNSFEQAGPAEDYRLALSYAQKAAAQNNGDGVWLMALAYEHGRGVEESVQTAIQWYERGAALGHAACQHSLACYYFRGDVLKKSNKKGFALCMKAAQQGYGLAMADIGRCYQFGHGVMGNMKTAVEWYEKALEVLDDPELARKTAMFKMMGEMTPGWDEDYPGEPEEDDDESDATAEQQARDALTALCRTLKGEAEDKLRFAVQQANAAAVQKAFDKAIHAQEEKRKALEQQLAAQSVFAISRKKEIRQQLAAAQATIDALQALKHPASDYAGDARLASALTALCARPDLKMTVFEMCGTEDFAVIRSVGSSLRALQDKGLIMRTEQPNIAVFHLAAYPAPFTLLPAPEEADTETECLRLAAAREHLVIDGEITFESAVCALKQKMLDGEG